MVQDPFPPPAPLPDPDYEGPGWAFVLLKLAVYLIWTVLIIGILVLVAIRILAGINKLEDWQKYVPLIQIAVLTIILLVIRRGGNWLIAKYFHHLEEERIAENRRSPSAPHAADRKHDFE